MPVVPGPPSPPVPSGDPVSTDPCGPWIARPLACEEEGDTDEAIDYAIRLASALVWKLSGRRYGPGCPITIRPVTGCHPGGSIRLSGGHVVRYDHQVSNDRGPYVFDLWRAEAGPVWSVESVIIDGVDLDPDTWQVEDARWLRRLDAVWPARQVMRLPLDQPGTWAITFRPGLAIPVTGDDAAHVLACEILTAKRDAGGRCRLPRKARTIARQGTTIDLIDPADFLVEGRLGIEEVDRFILSENPGTLPMRSRVISPDAWMNRPHRV